MELKSINQHKEINHSSNSTPNGRKLLVLVAAYSLEMIRSRKLEDTVTNRDLDGFFEHVWSVHPFASLVSSNGSANRYGPPETHAFAPRHTFIEGKVGRFQLLKWVEPLNFIISQICIFFSLVRLIRKEKISVIDAWTPLYPGLFALGLSYLCGVPFVIRVVTNHDKIYETTGHPSEQRLWMTRKIEKIIERFVLKRAHLVAGVNQDNLDFALANGANPEVSTLFRYGNMIDKQHFSEPSSRPDGSALLRELGVEPHRFLLYVGRLETVKHPDDVVRTLAKVRSNGHDVKAVLVGDGLLREKLSELARELRVENHTIFCGNKDQAWLLSVIPLATVVISPHTGLALLEVALGEASIVAYNVDWQGELIETGVTGELVAHQAWDELADATVRFLNNPEYSQSMGKAVRKRAIEMMAPAKLNQHERSSYLELFNRFHYQQIEKNIKAYNKTAKDYSLAHKEIFNEIEQNRLSASITKSLRAVNSGPKTLTAMDYGSGSGNIVRHLLDHNVDVVAADVSSHFLSLVREQFSNERLSTIHLNGKNLVNIKDDSFDFITLYSVLHLIPDYLGAIIELARVCKPGGIIYFDHEPNDEFYSNRTIYKEFQLAALRIDWKKYFVFSNYIAAIRRWFNPKYASEGDIHVWPDDNISFQLIEDLLISLGFEVIQSEDYLCFKELYRQDIYLKYESLCSDTRLMVFRKRITS